MAGLPNSRCNYARVFVNGTPVGQGIPGVNSPGIFVNAEPVMKRYIERNFNGNMKGNLYELEHHDDFLEERLKFIGVESLSKFEDKADLKFAIRHIKANGLAGADQLLDMDQFPEDLRDGVLPQALGRLRGQHQQHLHLQRRDRPSPRQAWATSSSR